MDTPDHGTNFDSVQTVPAEEGTDRRSIGPYRLLQRIGQGGMGEVWVAEQRHPIHRKVAIKVVRPDLSAGQVLSRFDAERQALALMDHPAIATVFDAGSTPDGRPYFAMEYVDGEPITTFCDRRQWPLQQRIELFLEVCGGVLHAHQKGIIHRDLKPSNVLVSMQDGRAVPKVIDFGIAKAVSHVQLTERTLFTQFGTLLGTPEYMSPEQAGLGPQDVDIRTDVYALGVLLYELLTGTLPFDSNQLREGGLEGFCRILRDAEAPRPSTRVSQLGDEAARVARDRQTDRTNLIGGLRGDLDSVILKALQKERARRYGSVSELASDLRHYLQHEPVSAILPSATYRVRKFVRRHRVGVAATMTILALLVALAVGSVIHARRVAAERDRAAAAAAKATAISRFLQETLAAADPSIGTGRDTTVLQALRTATMKIEPSFMADPLTAAAVRSTIGQTYMELGEYGEAEKLLRLALRTYDSAAPASGEVIDTKLHLVELMRDTDRRAEADALVLGVIDAVKSDPRQRPVLAKALNVRGTVLLQDQPEVAERYFRESIALYRQLPPDSANELYEAISNLGVLLSERGDYVQAEPLVREALAIDRKRFGSRSFSVAIDLNNLAYLHWRLRNYPDAEREYREAIELYRALLGANHKEVATTLNNLGTLLTERGGASEAKQVHEEALTVGLKTLDPNHWLIGNFRSNYGKCLIELGQYPQAEAALLSAYDVLSASLGAENARTRRAAARLAKMYTLSGQPERAERYSALAGTESP